jgi:phospholipid/cholesterol/gamma-HCH transport system permease protein
VAVNPSTSVGARPSRVAPQRPGIGGPRAIVRAEPVVKLLIEVGEMAILTGRTLTASLSRPYSWKAEFVEQAWIFIKRCTIPSCFVSCLFGFSAPGVEGGNVLNAVGSVDREGGFFVLASLREFAPWINGMVVAGVAGTAICADLGARKVREEFDAMEALALDPVRAVVVPRFLALGALTPLLNVLSAAWGVVGGWAATVLLFRQNTAGYFATFTANLTLPDVIGSEVKTLVLGFMMAIFSCYYGMNVSGGPAGVGRAVNRAVVASFVGIWVFNFMFNSYLLAAYPETTNLH